MSTLWSLSVDMSVFGRMVSFGVLWSGRALSGLVCGALVLSGLLWSGLVHFDAVWCDVMCCRVAWCGIVWCGLLCVVVSFRNAFLNGMLGDGTRLICGGR